MIPAFPEFNKPPVLEVVGGVQFERLDAFQTRHFGQFWSLVNSEFPNTQDAPPLPDFAEGVGVQFTPLPPLRRMFLVSVDNQWLIQLQDTRFHVNWRKRKESDPYPRFERIYRRLQESWDQFATFVSQNDIGVLKPKQYELTYVNHIEAPDQNIAASIEGLVRMFNWSTMMNPALLPSPSSVSAAWQFRLPQGMGQLSANLSHAERAKRQIVVLNISCFGPASPNYTFDEWFRTAHEWIVKGFADLTTERAHLAWERTA